MDIDSIDFLDNIVQVISKQNSSTYNTIAIYS